MGMGHLRFKQLTHMEGLFLFLLEAQKTEVAKKEYRVLLRKNNE